MADNYEKKLVDELNEKANNECNAWFTALPLEDKIDVMNQFQKNTRKEEWQDMAKRSGENEYKGM